MLNKRSYEAMLASKASIVLADPTHPLPDYGETSLRRNNHSSEKVCDTPEFKLLSWNIERGSNLAAQIAYLKSVDADILCLQEVDWHCMRSENKDVAMEIARALGYKYVAFSTAFVEIDDQENPNQHFVDFPHSKRNRRGIGRGGGVMGQAILSRFPIQDIECLKLLDLYDYEDPKNPFVIHEPIKGGRIAQKAVIKIAGQKITLYNAHLENRTGPTGRMQQYQAIHHDARGEINPIVIAADMNTGGEGIAQYFDEMDKLHPKFWLQKTSSGRDPLASRMGILGGKSEAQIWAQEVFNNGQEPNLEPTHKLDDPTYRIFWIIRRKLDWILMQRGKFKIKNRALGPFGLSDHRPLIVNCEIICNLAS